MSNTTDPELSVITNVCKPSKKKLTSQKLRSPLNLFCLKSFFEFVILTERIEPIACLVFYLVIKMCKNHIKNGKQ